MKNLMILAVLLTLSSCRDYTKSPYVPMKAEDYAEEMTKEEISPEEYTGVWIDGEPILKNGRKEESGIEMYSDEWIRQAEIFLSLEEGEVYYDSPKNRLNPKNTNKRNTHYSTNNIEYSEEWRVWAYKATKSFVIDKFPRDNNGCIITATGLYKPYSVKYIGNNTFDVKLYIKFKCKNDSYIHRKNLWFYTYYVENVGKFGVELYKERYDD